MTDKNKDALEAFERFIKVENRHIQTQLVHEWLDLYLETIRAALLSNHPEKQDSWMPIETAPRDGTEILMNFRTLIIAGSWNDQKYHKKPRPFWEGCKTYMGVDWYRHNQPTHWMPLPAPPK